MFQKVHVFRVRPKQELLGEIERYCREHHISSGVVVGLIGSLESARLNFLEELPGKYESVDFAGPLEIVAGQGSIATMDGETVPHVHLQLTRKDGAAPGGHLAEATVFSTAEVAIAELDYQLRRQPDSYTGLNELVDG